MTATDRYVADVQQPARWLVPGLVAIAVAWGVLSQTVWTYGRRRAMIVDRVTGQIVGRFTEPLIVSDNTPFGRMLTDLQTRTAPEFEKMWLRSAHNQRARGRANTSNERDEELPT